MIELNVLLFIFAVSGVVSFGITQIFKLLLDGFLKSRKIEEPFWRNSLLRFLAIIVGGGAGFFLLDNPSAILLGCSGGILNVFITTLLKNKLKVIVDKLINKK